ncbi:hypothetical protein [Bacillus sp. OAE603]|uniref:hypothetical protein n=1 Tax=Gottfriedia sp. OAE603 TaxID=2663872 RepID=UPI001789D6EF
MKIKKIIIVFLVIIITFNLYEKFFTKSLSIKEVEKFAIQHKLNTIGVKKIGNKTLIFYEREKGLGSYELIKKFGKVHQVGWTKFQNNPVIVYGEYDEIEKEQSYFGAIITDTSILKRGDELIVTDINGKKITKKITPNEKVYLIKNVNEIEDYEIQDINNKVIFPY